MIKILKKLLRILAFLFNRGLVIYVLAAALLLAIFDQKRAMLKTMDYLSDTPRSIARHALGREELDGAEIVSAIRYYKIFSKTFPNSGVARSALGYCYYQLGQDAKAIEYFSKALNLNPALFAVHYNLGLIYYQNKNFDKAIKHFQESVDTFIDDKAFALSGGISPYKFSFSKDLSEYNARTLEMKYIYAKCYENLIWSYRKKENYQAVLELAITGMKLPEKDNPSFFYHSAGWASYNLKEYDSAIRFFKKSLEVDPYAIDSIRLMRLSFEKLNRKNVAAQIKMNEKRMLESKKGHRFQEPNGRSRLFYYPPFNIIEVDGEKVRKM